MGLWLLSCCGNCDFSDADILWLLECEENGAGDVLRGDVRETRISGGGSGGVGCDELCEFDFESEVGIGDLIGVDILCL